MTLLSELTTLLEPILPVETGVFSNAPPSEYAVLTPITDNDSLFCDNKPNYEIQEVRISIYTQTNYINLKNSIVSVLRETELTITEKRYVGHEDSTGYFHYSIDVAKQFLIQEENVCQQ